MEKRLTALKMERLLKGIKQIDLTRVTGISNVRISGFENDYPSVRISPDEKRQLADALGVPVRKLFPEEEKSN